MFIFDPFTMLFDPAQRIFWPFVLGSIVIALLVGLWSKRVSCWKSGARFLFPARIWLHRSARLDYKLLFAKALIRALWIVPWSLSAYGLAVWTIRTLDQTIGAPSPPWMVICRSQCAIYIDAIFGVGPQSLCIPPADACDSLSLGAPQSASFRRSPHAVYPLPHASR